MRPRRGAGQPRHGVPRRGRAGRGAVERDTGRSGRVARRHARDRLPHRAAAEADGIRSARGRRSDPLGRDDAGHHGQRVGVGSSTCPRADRGAHDRSRRRRGDPCRCASGHRDGGSDARPACRSDDIRSQGRRVGRRVRSRIATGFAPQADRAAVLSLFGAGGTSAALGPHARRGPSIGRAIGSGSALSTFRGIPRATTSRKSVSSSPPSAPRVERSLAKSSICRDPRSARCGRAPATIAAPRRRCRRKRTRSPRRSCSG